MAAGTCKYCACTDDHACDGGCTWSDAARTICSNCAVVVDVAKHLVEMFGVVVKTPKAKLAATIAPSWDALTFTNQQLIVMASRALVDGIKESLLGGLMADALLNREQIEQISDFFIAHHIDPGHPEDTVADRVIRLLTPHVGSRIVRPDSSRITL